MSDKYLEAAENLLEDSDECRQLVRDIVEAWVGDRELYEIDCVACGIIGVRVTSANSDTVSSKLAEGEPT